MDSYSEEQLRAFTEQLNAKAEVTVERRQQWDLQDAYVKMDALLEANQQFTIPNVLELHTTLARHNPHLSANEKGRFSYKRKTFVGAEWELKPFAKPEEVDERIEKYLSFYNQALRFHPEDPIQYTRVIENALKAMVDFVDIHPFADGNGRMSRLLADALLLKAGLYQMPHWLPQIDGDIREKRKLFFSMVENARRGNDSPLLHFMLDQQVRATNQELEVIGRLSQAKEEATESGHLGEREKVVEVLQTAADMLKEEALKPLEEFKL